MFGLNCLQKISFQPEKKIIHVRVPAVILRWDWMPCQSQQKTFHPNLWCPCHQPILTQSKMWRRSETAFTLPKTTPWWRKASNWNAQVHPCVYSQHHSCSGLTSKNEIKLEDRLRLRERRKKSKTYRIILLIHSFGVRNWIVVLEVYKGPSFNLPSIWQESAHLRCMSI